MDMLVAQKLPKMIGARYCSDTYILCVTSVRLNNKFISRSESYENIFSGFLLFSGVCHQP